MTNNKGELPCRASRSSNETSTTCLGFAGKAHHRLLGLFDKKLKSDTLLIMPCHSIHTFGLKKAIDVAFFDKQGRVIASRRVVPFRVFSCPGAEGVIERRIPKDSEHCFEVGDQLTLGFS